MPARCARTRRATPPSGSRRGASTRSPAACPRGRRWWCRRARRERRRRRPHAGRGRSRSRGSPRLTRAASPWPRERRRSARRCAPAPRRQRCGRAPRRRGCCPPPEPAATPAVVERSRAARRADGGRRRDGVGPLRSRLTSCPARRKPASANRSSESAKAKSWNLCSARRRRLVFPSWFPCCPGKRGGASVMCQCAPWWLVGVLLCWSGSGVKNRVECCEQSNRRKRCEKRRKTRV
mmetsp:Transcript_21570/g.66927  ORF Transcript_21570/g.66927 Transcript_21570/m.66927 type:complete len:236 (-) Transcript_21570:153-860(-)